MTLIGEKTKDDELLFDVDSETNWVKEPGEKVLKPAGGGISKHSILKGKSNKPSY